MSDNVETPDSTPEAAPAPKPAAPAPKSDDLPDWARDQITKANQEAATNRVKLRQVEQERDSLAEKLTTLSSEKTDVSTKYSSIQGDFDKLATAIQTLYPESKIFAFAKTLQGGSEEELTAHAAELKEMFGLSNAPSPATDRSQGRGGEPSNSDPASLLAAFIKPSLTR